MAVDGRRIRKGALRRYESALHQNVKSTGARRRGPDRRYRIVGSAVGDRGGRIAGLGAHGNRGSRGGRYVARTVGTVREQGKHERRDADGIVRRAPLLL